MRKLIMDNEGRLAKSQITRQWIIVLGHKMFKLKGVSKKCNSWNYLTRIEWWPGL